MAWINQTTLTELRKKKVIYITTLITGFDKNENQKWLGAHFYLEHIRYEVRAWINKKASIKKYRTLKEALKIYNGL